MGTKSVILKQPKTSFSFTEWNSDEEIEDTEEDEESEQEDENSGEESVEDGSENNKNISSAKRKSENSLESEPSNKKRKHSEAKLLKPPTVKELNQLRETENLFHSNLFRLQIEEMLKEIKMKAKYRALFDQWFMDFRTFIENIDEPPPCDIMERKLFKKLKVKVPLPKLPTLTGTFQFKKPSSVCIIGSFASYCCLGPKTKVDVRVEMPEVCFENKDYLNHKYQRKRALYLSYLAGNLQRCSDLVETLHFVCHGDHLSPLLEIQPAGKLGKRISIVIHLSASSSTFRLGRFSPERNNVRPSWLLGEEMVSEEELTPTPHYNSGIVKDLIMDENEKLRAHILENQINLQEGIQLLKVWLGQRGLDKGYGGFSGYIMSMFVVYLLQTRRLNPLMSSYQVARNVWSTLGRSDWTKEGISLASLTPGASNLSSFHKYFDVVFMDATGYCNFCAHMKREMFFWVKQECELAIQALDNPSINSFQVLFMTSMPFLLQFDNIVSFQDVKKLAEVVEEHSPKMAKLDFVGYIYPQIADLIVDLIVRGLGQRISLLGIQSSKTHTWCINETVPSYLEPFTLGLRLNPEFAYSVLDKGPPADMPEAAEFRNFWGNKAEMRRFKDGSISEAVVWANSNISLAEKRTLCHHIVQYLLEEKLGISVDVFIADQLDHLIEQRMLKPAGFEYGTGEEAALQVITTLDDLSKQLRALKDLPLDISSIQGTSPVFRYSDVFPPLATTYKAPKQENLPGKCYQVLMDVSNAYVPRLVSPIQAQIQLTMSGKWPNNLNAVRRIKAAFYIKIAECLEKQCDITAQPYPEYVDILKNGFVFRLIIAHQREIGLLKEEFGPDGALRYRDTEESLALECNIIQLPKLTGALHGLHQEWPALGPTCCLAKRWLSSQMLDPHHFPDVCTELLVAFLFLSPEPFGHPFTPQLGFLHFLRLLANTNWNTEPIILNFNSEMTRDEVLEIETHFQSSRSTLPPLFIATPYDKTGCMWTKGAPSLQILIRVAMLAKEALKVIEDFKFSSPAVRWKQIFRPSLDAYNVLIHISQRVNAHRHEAVDIKSDKPKQLPEYIHRSREKIPVVGFDPVQFYVKELRESYSDHALFFHDVYGGEVIGVLWKPSSLGLKDFKVSHINCRKPADEHLKIVLNTEAIIEDFYILGSNVVSSIDVRS